MLNADHRLLLPWRRVRRGGDVFPAFVQFLKAPPADAAEKEEKLVAALTALNDFLAQQKDGPYTGGAAVTATDCSLQPKLYHLEVALRHFKGGWEIPTGLEAVRRYIDEFRQRESWKHTLYSPELIIAGWKPKLS